MTKPRDRDPDAHLRGSVAFLPNWHHVHAGLGYGESYYFDPHVRIDTDLRAKRVLWEHFGDIGLGEEHPDPDPTIDFGMCLLPAVFGCGVRFFANNWPRAIPLNLDPDAARRLTTPDLIRSEPMLSIVHQMDALEAEYGRITGDLNTTGVLNLLLDLRGNALYLDMHDSPELVHHLVRVATDAIIDLSRYVRSRLSREDGLYMHPNCANTHVSRETYWEFLFPADSHLSSELQPFGIHQCCNADELLAAYADVPGVRYVDVQGTTDLKLLAEAFPDLPMTVTLSPVLMRHATSQQVAAAVREIASTLRRPAGLEITAPALDAGTPGRNVRAFMGALRELNCVA